MVGSLLHNFSTFCSTLVNFCPSLHQRCFASLKLLCYFSHVIELLQNNLTGFPFLFGLYQYLFQPYVVPAPSFLIHVAIFSFRMYEYGCMRFAHHFISFCFHLHLTQYSTCQSHLSISENLSCSWSDYCKVLCKSKEYFTEIKWKWISCIWV